MKALPLRERLRILADARVRIADASEKFTAAVSPQLARNPADTLAAEVLPLLAAMRFLGQQAESILKPRDLGRRGLPLWLAGIRSRVHRVPFGTVLVIGPANYPLFLPGVQAVQALVAGNSVVWKPGRNGRAIAQLFAETLYAAGLPPELLRVTDESIEAVEAEIVRGVDKVFFTGSATVGRLLLHRLADTLTPCVVELSGCDAVIVLPDADLALVAKAIAFGMRLNGSATCMAPRRILLVDSTPERRQQLIDALLERFQTVYGTVLADPVRAQLDRLIADARERGGTVHGEPAAASLRPVLITGGSPAMAVAQADLFAPVVTLLDVRGEHGVLEAQQACPFGLTASIFGDRKTAERIAAQLVVGTVLINDLIVATADPRVPFGGRKQSGFGTTRGAEGLLEMTAPRTVTLRTGGGTRNYDATGEPHRLLFTKLIEILDSRGLRKRLRALRALGEAGKAMRATETEQT